jgi:hypothetical protein
MHVPRKAKKGHTPTVVSRKSVNRFIDTGLRIMSAKPCLYFHQTLSFPAPVVDARAAKLVFNKFVKGVLKFYQRHEMAIAYVQERRLNRTLHFHVCFLFFDADKLPYCDSRMQRDFRTDIFSRWNALNGGKSVRAANTLEPHEFNRETVSYFARALVVGDESARRAETNWWGLFNKPVILRRCTAPAKQQRKAMFDAFFKKSSAKPRVRAAVTNSDRAAFAVQPVTSVAPLAATDCQSPAKELADYEF